ncbi:MAG: hypothetical protein WCG19_03675 [Chlorobiaceae bacterium]
MCSIGIVLWILTTINRDAVQVLISAIGYIAPKDKLEGRDSQIFKERDQKLEAAREARKQKRLEMRPALASGKTSTTADTINQLTQQPRFSISS